LPFPLSGDSDIVPVFRLDVLASKRIGRLLPIGQRW
jgi:hypothetical protein